MKPSRLAVNDLNSIEYWFPRLDAAGLPVPRTIIVETDADLLLLLDGKLPDGWAELEDKLGAAAREVGLPCFLRTGHGSGKHEWTETCYVPDDAAIGRHVAALVEWSALVSIIGLPTNVWAVRELIKTEPLFHAFDGMPITREFRCFVHDGIVTHWQPYWDPDAIERPSDERWRELLAQAAWMEEPTRSLLEEYAASACRALGDGYWSVDFLQDAEGKWWLTDVADGARSYIWEGGRYSAEGGRYPVADRYAP